MEHSRQPQDPCESLFRVACVSLSSVLADCRSRIRRSTDFRFATQQLPHFVLVETLHTCCTWELKVLLNPGRSWPLGFNDYPRNSKDRPEGRPLTELAWISRSPASWPDRPFPHFARPSFAGHQHLRTLQRLRPSMRQPNPLKLMRHRVRLADQQRGLGTT